MFVNVKKYKKYLSFGELFGKLALNTHKIVINLDETKPKETNINHLNFENNDQLISRSESEFRIFVFLTIISFINNFCLMIIAISLSKGQSQSQFNLYNVGIPLEIKSPYLKIIYKNGSVFSSYFRKGTFSTARHEFDLPTDANYYFHYEYRGKQSYIHGYGNRDHFYQTSKNLNGKLLRRKHTFSAKNTYTGKPLKSGYNSSIVQIGQTFMLFGGGKNPYTAELCDADSSDCNIFFGDPFGFGTKECQCKNSGILHFWSMKKETFLDLPLITLPNDFGFLTGCTVPLDRNRVLLIGGHHVKNMNALLLEEFLVKHPANNQVAEFDFLKRKWHVLPKVPIKGDLDHQVNYNYVCGTSITKSGNRSIIVLAKRFDENYNSAPDWFGYDPSEQIWTKYVFPSEIEFPQKSHWFLIPILGELHLFLPNITLKYHQNEITATWITVEHLTDLPIGEVEFLNVPYAQN